MSLVCEKLRVLRLRKEQEFKMNVYEYAIIQYMFESIYWGCNYCEKYFNVPLENVESLANIFENIKLSPNCKRLDEDYVFNSDLTEKLNIILANCTMN